MAKDATDGDKEYYRRRYRDLYVRRCAEDRWSDDAQSCFLGAHEGDRDCAQLLTVKQRNMIECVDDAAATSGTPPETAEARAAIETACQHK